MVRKYQKKHAKRAAKRKGGRRLTNVNKSLGPFAQRYITTMKYSDTFTLGSLGDGTYRFNLNNLYDPNRTGVGHQPYGFDQLVPIYNRYRVIACSYAVQFYPSEGTSPIRFAVLPGNEEITNTTISDACEDPRAKWGIQVVGGPSKIVKGKVYLPSLLGRTAAEYRATQGPLANGGTPADSAVLNIYARGLNEGAMNAIGVITMKYTVEWFDPHILAQS